MTPAEIRTIKVSSAANFKEKGSEFIAAAYPCSAEEEFDSLLQGIKKEHYNAVHHCFAYKLSSGSMKYSDDGEPSGTAGIRILNAIDHFELANILIVVTRYFGGIKLGVGPLGKAYYTAAIESIRKAEIITLKAFRKAEIVVEFMYINHIHRILRDNCSKIIKTNYSEGVQFDCLLIPDKIEAIRKQIDNISRGTVKFDLKDDYYLI